MPFTREEIIDAARLGSVVLVGADLSYANLSYANLSGADLRGANLRYANLGGANLGGANLTGANLRGANLEGANLGGANLTGANLRGANLEGATMPEGFELPCEGCNLPPDDCECIYCGRCSTTVESTCGNCDRGTDCCCTCFHCSRCSENAESGCSECDCCTGCGCECESDDDDDDDEEEGFRDSNPTATHRAVRGECARLAGVEYETTERPSPAAREWARKWGAGWHADGSCGYEAVTPPCAGSKIDSCITELAGVIGDTDGTCGIHVHVDAADYRWADTYRFLRVFAKLEGLLFVLGGQKRLTNQYCPPCGVDYLDALASEDPKNAVLALAYGVPAIEGSTRDKKGRVVPTKQGKRSNRHDARKKTSGRYKSLNIAPWVFGRRLTKRLRADTTFEFRLHSHGDGAKRVIAWTHLCVALVDWCAKASDAEVTKLPRSALRALCQIAPGSKGWILARIRDWRAATATSGRYALRRVDPSRGYWRIKRDPQYRYRPYHPAPLRLESPSAAAAAARHPADISNELLSDVYDAIAVRMHGTAGMHESDEGGS